MPTTENPSSPQSPSPSPPPPSPEGAQSSHGDAAAPVGPAAEAAAAPPATDAAPRAAANDAPAHAAEGDAAQHAASAEGPEGSASTGEAAAHAPEGQAAPGGDATGQPARKRRRRRRKKGPRPEGAAAGAPGAAHDEGEGRDEEEGEPGEAGAEAAAPAEGGDAKPEGEARKADKRQRPKKERPREPRERPAFNLGDVVFGKIIEITDQVLFVDLAGKGKALFDLRELTLPDDPAEEAAAAAAAEAAEAAEAGEDDEVHDVAGEMPTGESVPGATPDASTHADASPAPEHPAEQATEHAADGEAATAAHAPEGEASAGEPAADPPPTLASGRDVHEAAAAATTAGQETTADVAVRPQLIPTSDPHRKIVKPRHELEAEAKPPEPAPAAAAVTPEATPGEGDSSAAVAAPADVPSPGKPTAAMYAPPVVLEIGAHFVGLVHNDGSRGGLIVLTHHPHRASKAKLAANQAFKDKSTITALVTGVVKGGIEADFDGLRAFTPGSHMELRLGTDLHRFIGKRLDFYVTQYGKRGRDVVLSRKPMLEAEARAVREEALAKLNPGSIVEGTVRSVVSFGAFIDVGGVEGLVPLPEMSHNRSDTPSDVFKAGQTVSVKVTRIDEKGKIWLSRKAAIPDPWAEVAKKYSTGTKHVGKVVRLQPFGAFVELEPGVDGLIHTADLSIKRIEDPSEVVKVGDSIDVVVASLDPGAHKIGLHPAPTGAAEGETPQRVQMHKPVKCAVVAVEAGGLVVRVLGATGRHARGFITAAATGTARGTELRKPFPVGTVLDAKVIEIDPKRGEVKLSIKALREDTERNAYQQYRAQVKQEAKFGTFADLLAKKISK